MNNLQYTLQQTDDSMLETGYALHTPTPQPESNFHLTMNNL